MKKNRSTPSFLTQDERADTAPPVVVGVKTILEAQRRLTEEGNSLSLVNTKISETEQEIGRLKGGAPPAPTFATAREDLAAEIAVGNTKEDVLVSFDKEATAAQKVYDSAVREIREKISPLEATVAGLKRRAAIHNRTIENLRPEHRRLCQEYLLAQAEECGRRYAEAINVAVDAMADAIVFGSCHKRIYGENNVGMNYETFDVLPLGTVSTRGTLPPTDPVAWVKRFDRAEEKILAELKKAGIAVPFPGADDAPVRVKLPGIGIPVSIARPEDDLRGPDGFRLPTMAETE